MEMMTSQLYDTLPTCNAGTAAPVFKNVFLIDFPLINNAAAQVKDAEDVQLPPIFPVSVILEHRKKKQTDTAVVVQQYGCMTSAV